MSTNLPSSSERPSLLDWLEEYFHLPFRLPRLLLPRTAANVDKAAAMIVLAGGENVAARIQASTTRIVARSAAEKTFIERGQREFEAGADELRNRAIEYALGDAILKQQNREEILRLAGDHIALNPPKEDASETIGDDWLNAFIRYAETKSKADVQQLWGRILSAEIRKPGSSSLRTLDFLSTISSDEANRIATLFALVIDNTFVPAFAHDSGATSFSEMLFMQEIGVLGGTLGLAGTARNKSVLPHIGTKYSAFFSYFEMGAFLLTEKADYIISVPAVVLTSVGCDLFAITETKRPNYSYFFEFLKTLGNAPLLEIIVGFAVHLPDNQVRLQNPMHVWKAP